MKDALGWIEAVLDEEILRERYSLIIGKVVCAEINDAYMDNKDLKEMPAIMLSPYYRLISEKVMGNVEDTMKLFIP